MTTLSDIIKPSSSQAAYLTLRNSTIEAPGRWRVCAWRALLAASVILAIPAAQASAQSEQEKAGVTCHNWGCGVRDRLGGVGLLPVRTYRLVYGSAPICTEVLRTLNETLRNPAGALARVTLPLAAQPGVVDASPEYVAQNPLYSAPMFLRWQYLGGTPRQALAPRVEGGGGYDGKDAFLARWQIVPLLGVRRLVTATAWGQDRDGLPPTSVVVWDVPEEELERHDWNIPASYRLFNYLAQDPHLDPMELMHNLRNPRSFKWAEICLNTRSPKWKTEPNYHRSGDGVVNFARIDGRIYTLIADTLTDIISVFDAGEKLDRAICNFESSITTSLLRDYMKRFR